MKKLYIADIKGHVENSVVSGHILPVARNYKEVLSSNFDIKIAAGPAILNSFHREDCLVLPYNICTETIRSKFKILVNFIFLLYSTKRNPIIIQQSTSVTSFIAITLFHWWINKIFLIQYDTVAINSRFRRMIYSLCKYKISGFICPNDRIGKAFGRPYCVVTDYIRTEKPLFKSYSERKWDICMVGGISDNKGVVEAAEFLAKSNYKVLIAGQINEPTLEPKLFELCDNFSNLECHFSFLTDQDYINGIHNSKFCMLNYKGCYMDRSSGAVLDNVFLGTPVIGRKCNALDIVEDNKLGYVYEELRNLDLNSIITRDNFDIYIGNIAKFFDKQQQYKNELIKFLEI